MLQYGPTKTAHFVPESFTVLDDFLVVALGLRWVLDVAARRASPPTWVTTWLLIWIGVGTMTAVARGIGFMTVAVTYRWLFLPGILYLLCAHYARQDGFARRVIRMVIGIALLQAALAIVQAGLARSIGDSAYGLLGPGGANALGFIILLAIVLVAASDKPLSSAAWLVALASWA